MNGGPIGPKKTITRYRWEMPLDEARAVGEALLAAGRTGDPTARINLDDMIALHAPNAERVEYEVPIKELTDGDGHMHYLWPEIEPEG